VDTRIAALPGPYLISRGRADLGERGCCGPVPRPCLTQGLCPVTSQLRPSLATRLRLVARRRI